MADWGRSEELLGGDTGRGPEQAVIGPTVVMVQGEDFRFVYLATYSINRPPKATRPRPSGW